MDYAKPADVVAAMIDASGKKLALAPRDLLIRGALSGALLGAATTLAFTGAVTTGQPLVGALIFPVSLVAAEIHRGQRPAVICGCWLDYPYSRRVPVQQVT